MTTDGRAAGGRARGAMDVRSHLFAVRVWREDGAAGSEYRGRVRDVVSGAFHAFREWSDLVAFMVARIEEAETATAEASDAGGQGDGGSDG